MALGSNPEWESNWHHEKARKSWDFRRIFEGAPDDTSRASRYQQKYQQFFPRGRFGFYKNV
jgi:hypothetical protein